MKALFTVSEIAPWVKTGGLGDVAAALPAAMHVAGGLADTVIDASDTRRGNGFVFGPATPVALLNTLRRAAGLWRDNPRRWETLQCRGMIADFSWRAPAQRYTNLYHTLLKTH